MEPITLEQLFILVESLKNDINEIKTEIKTTQELISKIQTRHFNKIINP
jgi:hypothetical protein